MQYLLAILPILTILVLMIFLKWGGQKAGPVGLLFGIIIAALSFGLTLDVLWVSQVRGLLLSFYVLAVLWPALFLYQIVNQAGGIRAIAMGLESVIKDRGILLIILAWGFSSLLEGLAGFGLPIAVVAPMLVALGVAPVTAVAAVAVGHSWSVTFGDMGVIYQTLIGVSGVNGTDLAPYAAVFLGIACLACGFAAARILGEIRRWVWILFLGILMASVQFGLAISILTPLAALGAGMSGVIGAMVFNRNKSHNPLDNETKKSLIFAILSYASLTVLLTIIAWPGPIRSALFPVSVQFLLPEVRTTAGFVTPAGVGQIYRPLVHPGTSILLIAMLSFRLYSKSGITTKISWKNAARATWKSAAPASIGILSTVGLSALMDHSGMTILLAQGLSQMLGSVFPIVSSWVGMLGAFATGSNNNSNVLFAPLQKNIAAFLRISPMILLATQTAGGALGSMIAPAKIIIGCNNVNIKDKEGEVLKKTLPYSLLIGFILGLTALIFIRLFPFPL